MLLANLIVWFAKEHLLRIFDCRRFTVADDHVNVKDDADEQDWRQDWRHRRLHLDAVGWSHWRSDNWKTCPTSPLIKAFILKILFPTQKNFSSFSLSLNRVSCPKLKFPSCSNRFSAADHLEEKNGTIFVQYFSLNRQTGYLHHLLSFIRSIASA